MALRKFICKLHEAKERRRSNEQGAVACRDCMCPVVLTRGADQTAVSTAYEMREDENVARNYGRMLVELAAAIPDGIVCFFVSYSYMDKIVSKWNDMGVLQVLAPLGSSHINVPVYLFFPPIFSPALLQRTSLAMLGCLRVSFSRQCPSVRLSGDWTAHQQSKYSALTRK